MSCSYRSITLQPGESYVLPAGAEIISATDSGSITSVNDCANINVQDAKCYRMIFSVNESDGGSTSPDSKDYILNFEIINIETYPIANAGGPGGPDEPITSGTSFQDVVDDGYIWDINYTYVNTGDRYTSTLDFKTIPSLASIMRIAIISPGFDDALYVFPVEISC